MMGELVRTAVPEHRRRPLTGSTGNVTGPAWTRNGRELFYLLASNVLTSVPIQTMGPALQRHQLPPKDHVIPARSNSTFDRESFPTRSARIDLSKAMTADTFATESFGRPVCCV